MLSQLTGKFVTSNYDDWTKADKGEVCQHLVPYVYKLDREDLPRQQMLHKNLMLYSNTHVTNLYSGFSLLPSLRSFNGGENRVIYNIAKSAVNTVAAKISKNKIKINVAVDRGDFGLQKKAEKLDETIFSIFQQAEFHQVAKQVFVDACISGTGIIQVIENNGKVAYERVLPFEVLVDELDALYAKPKKIYRHKLVSIATLKQMFPDKAKEIDNNANTINNIGSNSIAPAVVVFEAWCLLSKKHVVCIEGVDLIDEEWVAEEFPFMFLHYHQPQMGFWGGSLVDEISPFQLEINKLLYFVQKSMHLNSAPKWLVAPNSIPKNMMSNEIGAIIPVNGVAPQYIAPQPIHNQIIQHIQMLKDEAYAIAGLSQLSARSEKPGGITAGIALQTLNDIESQRFILVGQQYEELYVDAFRRTIDKCKEIAKDNPDFSVGNTVNFSSKKLKWSEIDLDKDMYTIKLFPASALPQEPSARLQRLNEWLEMGFISKEDYLEIADIPDLKSATSNMYSQTTVIKSIIHKILSTKTYIAPSKYLNLMKAQELALNTLNNLIVEEAEQELIDLIEQFLDECTMIIEDMQMQQAQMEQQMAPEPVQPIEEPTQLEAPLPNPQEGEINE
jgi:hypothetical protein